MSSNSGSEISLDTSSNSIPKNAEKRQNKNTGTSIDKSKDTKHLRNKTSTSNNSKTQRLNKRKNTAEKKIIKKNNLTRNGLY